MLRQILEKGYEFNIELHSLFTDFKQAFDKVDRQAMYKALKFCEVPNKLVKMVQITLQGSNVRVKTFHGTTESFEMYTGVRQGDNLSPILFNFVLESALSNTDRRGNISDRLKEICAYADDIAITARTKKCLIETFEIIIKDVKKHGLIIKQMKTKYMYNSKKNIAMKDMKTGQMKFEKLKSFKYLGTQLNSQNSTNEVIECDYY